MDRQTERAVEVIEGLLYVTDYLTAPREEGEEDWPQIEAARRYLASATRAAGANQKRTA